MPATPAQPVEFAPLRRRPSMDFSLAGLVYCAMILFMGLAAINTQANLLFGVFGLMIGIMGVSWFVGRTVLRQLGVRRMVPPHLVVGVPTTLHYEINNRKRYWPSLSVSITELDGTLGFNRPPQGYMLHAAPGMTASVPVEVVPIRRGVYELNRYQLTTTFPFGFIRRALTGTQKDMVLIYPPIANVERRLLALCRSADDSGESVRPRPGGMDEFYGVRQYRPGDNPRWVYWRRSARTGVLVVREMTRVAPPRLMIAVDTFAAEESSEQQGLIERSIAMAASLASAALEDGLSVGVCAWAGDRIASVQPDRGKQQREDVLTLLARLPCNTDYPRDELMRATERMVDSSATAVLVTPANVQSDLLLQRGGALVLSAANDEGRRWFHFPDGIDFTACVPAEFQKAGKQVGKTPSRQGSKERQQVTA